MAENLLGNLTASSLFDLTGVVAVVTGGGSVCFHISRYISSEQNPSHQGIGLMISSTLVANGAKVYIIGPKQVDLDSYEMPFQFKRFVLKKQFGQDRKGVQQCCYRDAKIRPHVWYSRRYQCQGVCPSSQYYETRAPVDQWLSTVRGNSSRLRDRRKRATCNGPVQ